VGYALQNANSAAGRAQLQGPIAFIDGEDVSEHGDLFVLPAGCHVVTTVDKWMDDDQRAGIWVKLTPLTYAIDMAADHNYFIRFSGGSSNGLTANFSVDASETDSNRGHVRKLEPADSGDLDTCRYRHEQERHP
jgi:hypothetical protein